MTSSVKTINVQNKIKTAFWFIKNPQYSSQILQVLKRKGNSELENSTC